MTHPTGTKCEIRIIYDREDFRVINNGESPQETFNIIVQRKIGNEWKEAASFNSLSDDYAYTNARECCDRLKRASDRMEQSA